MNFYSDIEGFGRTGISKLDKVVTTEKVTELSYCSCMTMSEITRALRKDQSLDLVPSGKIE
jgi:hypothetical protein